MPHIQGASPKEVKSGEISKKSQILCDSIRPKVSGHRIWTINAVGEMKQHRGNRPLQSLIANALHLCYMEGLAPPVISFAQEDSKLLQLPTASNGFADNSARSTACHRPWPPLTDRSRIEIGPGGANCALSGLGA